MIVPKNYPSSDRDSHIKAVMRIIGKMKVGDYLQLSVTKKNSTVNVLSQCFPGCPPKTWWEQIFGIGEECNTTRMKRDKNHFDSSVANVFIKLIKKGNVIEDGITDLFLTLEGISNFQKLKSFDKSYIISSMNPLETEDIYDKDIDELFVKIVEENRVPKNLPDAEFAGVLQNSKILTFWNDIFSINKKKFVIYE